MKVRKACPNEAKVLSDLAYASEAYWGEDETYMRQFSEQYNVTEQTIREDHVYVLETDGEIVGFFAILKRKVPELELFYIKREYIGKGYGKKLWTNMISVCKALGISKIELVGSDDVVDFYIKLGAKPVEKVASTLKVGRMVTRFEVEIT